MKQTTELLVSTILMVSVSAGVNGTELLFTLSSPTPVGIGQFGVSVAGAGDVNNDGFDDVVIGAAYEHGGATQSGKVYVFSGQSGVLIHTLLSGGAEGWAQFGWSVDGAGDVNDDGYDDIIVGAYGEAGGAPDAGRAYLFSGQTGAILRTLVSPNPEHTGEFGRSVSGAGDVNDDGYPDVVIGAHAEDGGALQAGRIYVISGLDGSVLHTIQSPYPQADGHFGFSVAGIADVNNDDHDDIIAGAVFENGGAPVSGRAYVFSGSDGTVLHTLIPLGPQQSGFFGWSVADAGDVNNDGVHDVIVGARNETSSAQNSGRAHIYSGMTGEIIHTLLSPCPENTGYFGWSVDAAGDMNADGYDDVMIGAYNENGAGIPQAGRAYVFSGQTADTLATIVSPNPEDTGLFGIAVSSAGDVNNDGMNDLVIGASYEDCGASNDGRVYVFSPEMPSFDLSIALDNGAFVIGWGVFPGAVEYWIYGGENEPFFNPGLSSPYQYRLDVLPATETTWESSLGVGDTSSNWIYLVVAVGTGDIELIQSDRFGEFDY